MAKGQTSPRDINVIMLVDTYYNGSVIYIINTLSDCVNTQANRRFAFRGGGGVVRLKPKTPFLSI